MLNLKWAGRFIRRAVAGHALVFRCDCRLQLSPYLGAEWAFCDEHEHVEPAAHESFAEQFGACWTLPRAA
jgi:hypothetical protein